MCLAVSAAITRARGEGEGRRCLVPWIRGIGPRSKPCPGSARIGSRQGCSGLVRLRFGSPLSFVTTRIGGVLCCSQHMAVGFGPALLLAFPPQARVVRADPRD